VVVRVRLILLLLLAPWLAVASGCGRVEGSAAGPHVAARVNGMEISAQQLTAGGRQAAGQALERVIDRELLVQKAIDARLDRDPQVVQAIDSSRRQILAQAYLQTLPAGKVSAAEVRTFYQENPALYAERRIYRVRELQIAAPVERIDLLQDEAARARDLEDVVLWVSAHGLKYRISSITEPAEEVPLAQLPQLARMREGEIAVFSTPLGASVVQLVVATHAALTEAQAAPQIEQFLAGRKRLEVAAAEVRKLRQAASIEYAGEFKRN
jgi:EpsD family peptidyl-prolyl cis-trans isomerase